MENLEAVMDVQEKKVYPTDTVKLLEYPYGEWEVDTTDPSTNTLYLVEGPGTVICLGSQVRKIKK